MKKILLGLLASLSYCYASAAGYYVVIPKANKGLNNVNDAISVSLNNVTVPPLFSDEPYSFDFGAGLSVSGDPLFNGTGVSWSATPMLSGFSINSFGVLTGSSASLTPTAYNLTVTADYKGKKATRTYSVPIEEARLRNIVDYSVGSLFSCALNTSGEVWCWGDGNGTYATKKTLPKPAKDISVGATHACAVTTDGTAYCWGSNTYGELGAPDGVGVWLANYNTAMLANPVQVGLSNISQISAGYMSTCAVTTNNALYCWGNNSTGSLGIGTSASPYTHLSTPYTHIPMQVTGGGPGTYKYVSINQSTCGLTVNNSVNCWGWSMAHNLGRAGNYDNVYGYEIPGPVIGLENNVSKIYLSTYGGCALLNNATVKCWGHDYDNFYDTAVDIGLSNVTEFMTMNGLTCYKANGQDRCWGFNSQLNGATPNFSELPGGSVVQRPGRLIQSSPSSLSYSKQGSALMRYSFNWADCFRENGSIKCFGGSAEAMGNKSSPIRTIDNMGYVTYKNQ